jgi:hypothetical protein
MHVETLAVDHGVSPLALQHHAERVGRMPVRTCRLARQNHLVGADHGANGGVAVALDRVEQDQISAFGEFGIDQPAGGGERGAALLPAPMHGPVGLARRIPQRRLVLGPAGLNMEGIEIAVEIFESLAVLEVVEDRRHVHVPIIASG